VHLGYSTEIWLSLSKLPLQCAVASLYSVVKQRLKCNTGKVCNSAFTHYGSFNWLPTPFISAQRLSEHTVLHNLDPLHWYLSRLCSQFVTVSCRSKWHPEHQILGISTVLKYILLVNQKLLQIRRYVLSTKCLDSYCRFQSSGFLVTNYQPTPHNIPQQRRPQVPHCICGTRIAQ
jgi:hypothetical protein